MAERFKGIDIYGPQAEASEIPALTKPVHPGDRVVIDAIDLDVIGAAAHTRGHVMFYTAADTSRAPILFSGDALFVAGCGRFFEGDADDMYALLETLLELDPVTEVYCGHEYTLANMRYETYTWAALAFSGHLTQVSIYALLMPPNTMCFRRHALSFALIPASRCPWILTT